LGRGGRREAKEGHSKSEPPSRGTRTSGRRRAIRQGLKNEEQVAGLHSGKRRKNVVIFRYLLLKGTRKALGVFRKRGPPLDGWAEPIELTVN